MASPSPSSMYAIRLPAISRYFSSPYGSGVNGTRRSPRRRYLYRDAVENGRTGQRIDERPVMQLIDVHARFACGDAQPHTGAVMTPAVREADDPGADRVG